MPPLKIDPCAVLPPDGPVLTCHAVPLNQPDKPEYDRAVEPMNICVTAEEYAAVQKYNRQLLRLCGDRCQ